MSSTCQAVLEYVRQIDYNPRAQEIFEVREVTDYRHNHPAADAAAEETEEADI